MNITNCKLVWYNDRFLAVWKMTKMCTKPQELGVNDMVTSISSLRAFVINIVFVSMLWLALSTAANAQSNYFRVIKGIPHLPVFSKTKDIANAKSGMFIYSVEDGCPMLYTGTTTGWLSLCQISGYSFDVGLEASFIVNSGIPYMSRSNGTNHRDGEIIISPDYLVKIYHNGTWVSLDVLDQSTPFNSSYSYTIFEGTIKLPVTFDSYIGGLTGIEKGALYVYQGTATVKPGLKYYNGSSWKTLNCNCPSSVTVNHTTPETKSITYNVVKTNLNGKYQCWITKNLGASQQATSSVDNTDASAGWYWQFNRKQGFKYTSSPPTLTPSELYTPVLADSTDMWQYTNDPCRQVLGGTWRLPTIKEYENLISLGGFLSLNDAFSSVLKLHAAGYINNKIFGGRGSIALYWSASAHSNHDEGRRVYFSGTPKSSTGAFINAYPVRCLKDL